ncbi:MAG: hypothetical protein DRN33_04105 [Thermoplasmata archaeon]|nr:MAG: hypothetical protein DRN33_04105 [Thermoplasmata archaeon]
MKQINKFVMFGLALILFAGLAGSMASAAVENNTSNDLDWGAFWLFSGAFCFVYVILFIIWIAIGVWMYRDAEKRGKSGALWLIIGLLFGIIGLIIWLIVRPPEPSFYEKKAAGEEKKERICPSCGRSIPFDAKVCPYCGKNFEE